MSIPGVFVRFSIRKRRTTPSHSDPGRWLEGRVRAREDPDASGVMSTTFSPEHYEGFLRTGEFGDVRLGVERGRGAPAWREAWRTKALPGTGCTYSPLPPGIFKSASTTEDSCSSECTFAIRRFQWSCRAGWSSLLEPQSRRFAAG